MVKKFAIKQPKPQAAVIGKPQERIVFGFSELRPYSYVNCHNDSSFFISFFERLKKATTTSFRLYSLNTTLATSISTARSNTFLSSILSLKEATYGNSIA